MKKFMDLWVNNCCIIECCIIASRWILWVAVEIIDGALMLSIIMEYRFWVLRKKGCIRTVYVPISNIDLLNCIMIDCISVYMFDIQHWFHKLYHVWSHIWFVFDIERCMLYHIYIYLGLHNDCWNLHAK